MEAPDRTMQLKSDEAYSEQVRWQFTGVIAEDE